MIATKLMTKPLTNPHCLYLHRKMEYQSKIFGEIFQLTFVYVHED